MPRGFAARFCKQSLVQRVQSSIRESSDAPSVGEGRLRIPDFPNFRPAANVLFGGSAPPLAFGQCNPRGRSYLRPCSWTYVDCGQQASLRPLRFPHRCRVFNWVC
jgi:hypothetical protein